MTEVHVCTPDCYEFAQRSLGVADVHERSVLEVGARDFNGSVRGFVESLHPASYVSVDMLPGPGVDVVCKAENLVDRFGLDAFDVVISTEMLEHVRHWKEVVRNLKAVVRPGGVLILTTRSKGFPFHGCPGDFWRYETADFERIFADTTIERLECDVPAAPGVFLKARKPDQFSEVDLADYRLYSVVRRCRIVEARAVDVVTMKVAAWTKATIKKVLPEPLRETIRRRFWRTV